MISKLVMATNNANKLREAREILAPLGIEVLSQREAGADCEPDENGATFAENAYIKAKAVYDAVGLPTIADDSGLCVEALGGRPGVYSARYAPKGQECAKLLDEMSDIPDGRRGASFVCNICYIDEKGHSIMSGECKGAIGREERGENGFGYDPVFLVGDKTMAELTSVEKNSISHRGAALRELYRYLKETVNDMLTSKQRAYLRGIASTYETIFQVGKGGVTEAMCKDISEALRKRELIKLRVLDNSGWTAREAADAVAEMTGADVVQVIGSRFVLFKRNEKEPVIENIPRAK